MANKEALRDLQSRLAERLQAAKGQANTATWLAVESGGQGFLLPLSDAGEIFPFTAIVPVPHTADWFLGVANLRGGVHGVVDLARFLGMRPASGARPRGEGAREQARLVAFNPTTELNCALLVERLAGLRSRDQLKPDGAADSGMKPGFVGGRFQDGSGRPWQEVSLAGLAAEESFLRIVG